MQVTGEKFTAKMERTLVALLDCGEVKRAAEVAGVNESTAWRWLQTPDFQSRYRELRRQLVETAVARLQSDCTIAVRTLREVAENTSAPASARVAAARTIIEQSIAAVELSDVLERLERLEAAQTGPPRPRGVA